MNPTDLAAEAQNLADAAHRLALHALSLNGSSLVVTGSAGSADPFVYLFAIFILACFVGYYVVWNVTPALHSPLMGVTNAISSVIVVGAMLATGLSHNGWARVFGFIAVVLASVNIFGGFTVTGRMLAMFTRKGK